MKKHILNIIAIAALILSSSMPATATTYYVSVTGNDSNNGLSLSSPWRTFQKALLVAQAGDVVYFRGGTYVVASPSGIIFDGSNSGTAASPISYLNYGTETPIFDFQEGSPAITNPKGLSISGVSYINFRGFEIKNVGPAGSGGTAVGIYVEADNINFDRITVRDIDGIGFDVHGNNLFFNNCDAINCFDSNSSDPGSGGNGWQIITDGSDFLTSFTGCRAMYCSANGWDCELNDGVVTWDYCWAIGNGKNSSGVHYSSSSVGNGFKLGHNAVAASGLTQRVLKNCIAADNYGIGITEGNEDYPQIKIAIYNCVSYHNEYGFVNYVTSPPVLQQATYRNNIAYGNITSNALWNDESKLIHDHNSWNAGVASVTDADFTSLSTGQLYSSSRKADGSLPDVTFMKLAPGSDLIDAGINVGLPYSGAAPDIGWFEYSGAAVIIPEYVSSVIENATPSRLDISYNLSLANIIPAPSAFAVLVNSVTRAINSVSIVGNTVQLTLASPVNYGDVITVSYTRPATNPLQTPAGGQAASFASRSVINHVGLGIVVPSVTTSSITSITQTSARSGGIVTSNGGATVTRRGICWNTSPNPTTANDTTWDGSGTGSFISNLTGLIPNTVYYIRAYAINSAGIGYGGSLSFTTCPSAPVVGTITQPTCTVGTGSVVLSGLPPTGNWTLTRTPDGTTTTGSGTSATVPGLPSGKTYTFTVTNSGGCISASSQNVVILAQPTTPAAPVVGTITQPTCTVSTGSVTLSGLPSIGAWTLIRYPGPAAIPGNGTTVTLSSFMTGTYNFTVTNSDGCVSPLSGNVVFNAQPLPPGITESLVTDVNCFGGANGAIDLTVTGGSAPYTYSWSTEDNTQDISDLAAGSYSVTITGSNTCITIASFVVSEPEILSATVSSFDATCNGAGNGEIMISEPSGGTGWRYERNDYYDYSIDDGETWFESGEFLDLYPDLYVIQMRDRGVPECIVTLDPGLEIAEPDPLTATVTASDVTCNGGSDATITITEPEGGSGSYLFRFSGEESWHEGGIFTNISAGTYSIEIMDTGTECINTIAYDLVVSEPPALSVVADNVTNISCTGCTDGAITINASGGVPEYSFSWTGPGEFNSTLKDISSLTSGTFEVTVKDANLCTDTFTAQVFNPLEVTNTLNDGMGSLRNAINYANSHPNPSEIIPDEIIFNIQVEGTQTIQPVTPLPVITDPVSIDGYTQPGAESATTSTSAELLIEIDGTYAGESTNGLTLTSGNCSIKGLVIKGFGGSGISIFNNGGNIVEGNLVGTNTTGDGAVGNWIGIHIESSGNFIGGSSPEKRNIISGNKDIGVNIFGNTADNNEVKGNYVGTNSEGTAAVPNVQGVWIRGGHNNIIGGSEEWARNIVSGNTDNGIWIEGTGFPTSSGNKIQGNYVGLGVDGKTPIGNKGFGIKIRHASGNLIGGPETGDRNIVSGNGSLNPGRYGILIEYDVSELGNTIQGNYVGTDATGMYGVGNVLNGIFIFNAPNNIIKNNVIAGNNGAGIYILYIKESTNPGHVDVHADKNIVQGNLIGVKMNGIEQLGNSSGIIINQASNNIIGGPDSGTGNVISGSEDDGILIEGKSATGNMIIGNLIGTDLTGKIDIGNSKAGVRLNGSVNNVVGGVTKTTRNIISGNEIGVAILGTGSETDQGNNKVTGNFIGTDISGINPLGNYDGVFISAAFNNIIGGKDPGERNIISGNGGSGVTLTDDSRNNLLKGNFIGTNVQGAEKIPNFFGVRIKGAQNNIIGGALTGEGNLISGNGSDGIQMEGIDANDKAYPANGNKVLGNLIGTDITGLKSLGNSGNGISFSDNAANNLTGGTEPGAGNIIAFNKMNGVTCTGLVGIITGNAILSNSIFSNGSFGIDLGGDGVTPNDPGDTDASPNNYQNFPVLESLKFDLGTKKVLINGSLESNPSTDYTLQFFANKIDDAQGYGEGQRYLGSAIVSTGTDGKATFDASFTHYSSWGDIISATATDLLGNTSEFSMNIGGITGQIIAEGSWPFYYQVNEDGIKRITDGSDITAVESSFSAWNDVSTAAIDFRSRGTTPNKYASANDGINLVTFTDDKFPFSPGVLAVAAKTLRLSPTSDIAEIIDADIVVNPAYARYDVGVGYEGSNTGYFDAQSVITHEVGHVLGLLHTGIVSSTMFYMLDKGTSVRSLEQDDVSWASFTYQGENYSSYGSISGRITYGYDVTQPVAGALVVAINTSTNEQVHAYSDAYGNYKVPGLVPGNYNIHIQPLDGSDAVHNLKPANISAYLYINTIYTDYPGEYLDDQESGEETSETAATITVTAGAEVLNKNLITNKDMSGPEVVTVTPINNSLDFDINKDIIVTFSEAVDPKTLTDETCYIESGGVKHGVGHTPLGNSSSVIMLAPSSPFEYSTPYTLHITTGVKDFRGNILVPPTGLAEYRSTFKTIDADLINPVVINVYPLDKAVSVFVTEKIIVFFSEPMNRTSVENNLIVSWFDETTSTLNKATGSYAWDNENKSVTFIPLKALRENEEYTIKVTTGAADLSGLPLLSEKTFTFRTVPAANPAWTDIGPTGNDVPITTPVVVDFSEPIDPSTITKASLGLLLPNGNLVPGTYKFLNDNSRVVFTPDAYLTPATTYTIILTKGIKDLPAPGLELSNPTISPHKTFTTSVKPTSVSLTYIDPPAGAIGSVVTIGGVGFDPDPSLNTIKFNGISAVVTASTLTTLTTEVPVGAVSGAVTVTSGPTNIPATNQMEFYVVPQSTDPCNSATASASAGNNTGGTDLYGEALVFVTNPLSNTVTVVNTKTGTTALPIKVGTMPVKVDINPQGTLAYVTNFLSNDVSVIDIATRLVVATIKVGIHPYGVAVTPDGKRVYVANQYTNNLSVIDVDPKSGGFDHVVANVPVGTNPNDLEITGDAGLVLVAGDFGLQIINGNPNDEKYNCAVATAASGTKTTDVEVTADAGMAIVATEDNNLLVINLHPEGGDYSDAVVASVPAGTDISNIAVSGDAMFVYVSAPGSNSILVYQIGYGASGTPNGSGSGDFTMALHNTITGISNPDAMVIDPYAINLFVANGESGNRLITTITLCCGPVDPAKTIGDLIATIQGMNISQQTKDDLVFRLNEVLRNLAAGKNNTAMNNLNTFNNKINSLINSRKITREQGQPLIDAANKLKDQINLLPKGKSGDVENPETGLLNESGLGVIYPNPSSKSFTIGYEISEMDDLAGKVTIRVLDMNGVIVNTLLDQAVHTGKYSLIWSGTADNGTPVSGGTYFVYFRAGKIEKVKMIILIK